MFDGLRVELQVGEEDEEFSKERRKKALNEWKTEWKAVLKAGGAKSVERIWSNPDRLDCLVIKGKPDDSMLKIAKKNKIPCVNIQWITQCIINKQKLDFEFFNNKK